MKVFVTGGSGYIGRAVLRALAARGHRAFALSRSGAAEAAVGALGATPVRGGLDDVAALRAAASEADAVIHLGSAGGPDNAAVDERAASAMQDGVGGGPYVHTGGLWVYGDTGGVVAEHAPTRPPAITAWRLSVERRVLTHPGRPVLIMPGVVYGESGGLIRHFLADRAKRDGYVPCVGDGAQRWTLVHVEDVAELYVLALGAPRGAVYAGVSQCETMRSIAEAVSVGAGRPGEVRRLSLEQAEGQMGPVAEAFALDQQMTAARARAELGWRPRHADALGELARGA